MISAFDYDQTLRVAGRLVELRPCSNGMTASFVPCAIRAGHFTLAILRADSKRFFARKCNCRGSHGNETAPMSLAELRPDSTINAPQGRRDARSIAAVDPSDWPYSAIFSAFTPRSRTR